MTALQPVRPTTGELIQAAAILVDTSADYTADEFAAVLDAFVEAADDKIRALRFVAKAAESRADSMRAEAALYAAAARAQAAVAERVTARAFQLMEAAELVGETLPGARLQANGGKPALLYALDFAATALPFTLQRVSVEPDADAIRAAIAKGEAVPGVSIRPAARHLRWTP